MHFFKLLSVWLISLVIVPVTLVAQSFVLPAGGHHITSLNGSWNAIVDPYETGYYDYRFEPRGDGYFRNRQPESKSDLVEYNFERSDDLQVPGDWNTQRDELFFYEGTIWYHRKFDYELPEGKRLFVWTGAANYEAISWLNGEKLGEHTGGFTPFWFEITDLVRETGNDLVFKVDNKRHREGVPTLNTDWWNYGGITRDLLLVEVPGTFIREYNIQLTREGEENKITGWIQLDGDRKDARNVTVSVSETGLSATATTGAGGRAAFDMPAGGIQRWSPDTPRLYDVEFVAGEDTVYESAGFRTIETDGRQILLNGEPVFLKGISLHEEAPLNDGRASRPEEAELLLKWIKELGANFVRLAHYPHNRHFTRMADKMGIMVWSEIPVYWTILWENRETYRLAEQQLTEMIERDRNRPSVIIWSVANETPRKEARHKFLGDLVEKARNIDSSRLITAATELSFQGDSLIIDDPLGEKLDVIGANEYLGWYGSTHEEIEGHTWVNRFDKPLIISEFGAGAKQGYHGDRMTRWTEEYQAELYRRQLKMLDGISFLNGMCPWLLTDFLSPRRPLPDIQDYYNRKGLISDRGLRKQAFYILQDYYLNRNR